MTAVLFYDVVVAAHVASILIAFGVIFTYPVVVPYLVRRHPGDLPALHAIQERVGSRIIAPFGGIALLLGIYLASDRHYWSETWVTVPLVILVVLLAMGGLYFSPTEARMGELARRDQAAGAGAPSAEYLAIYRRWMTVASIGCVLVLVAVFFMVAKPFS